MMKICYVTTLSVSIKAFFIPQLKHLAKNGFEVSVICSPDPALPALLGEDIRYIPVEMPRGIDVKGSLRATRELTRVFREEKFDLVQYSTPNAALYASIAAKRTGVKVRNYHLMGLRYLGETGLKRRILRFLERVACRKSTHIECVSPSNLQLAVEEGLFPAEKGTVVFNGSTGGVDLSRFDHGKSGEWRAERREEYGLTENDFVYGFVGRITGDKGVRELLAAFEAVREESEDARLVLIGAVDEENGLSDRHLQAIKEGKGIIHIDQKPDVERYYPMLDVLVLPSYREGFGNVVIEAEAMGVPVIVSDIPGPVDAFSDGKTGVKIPAKNVDALAEAMRDARSFAARGFGENAVEFVTAHFDSAVLCEKIYERKCLLLNKN